MATISFSRPITVNSEWGAKNFEKAIESPVSLSKALKDTPKLCNPTRGDWKKLKEKYSR